MDNLSQKEQLDILNQYFLSTAEAMEILAISRQSFYSLINRNKITKIKKGGAVLFFRDEILGRAENQVILRKKYRPYDRKY
ncbi:MULTISPECIES: helix-turn-helix domain-containing protein [Listeria]|uniref:helix-turn-helix domain-containing protein n=1 Tax=Listeria TaxID=1637 RepID=UPI001F071F2C|nr:MULTISPECIES: helix-turn-helix domain-containing protein [Listeria]